MWIHTSKDTQANTCMHTCTHTQCAYVHMHIHACIPAHIRMDTLKYKHIHTVTEVLIKEQNYRRRLKGCAGTTDLTGLSSNLSGSQIGAMVSSSPTEQFSPFVLSKNVADSVSAQSHENVYAHPH